MCFSQRSKPRFTEFISDEKIVMFRSLCKSRDISKHTEAKSYTSEVLQCLVRMMHLVVSGFCTGIYSTSKLPQIIDDNGVETPGGCDRNVMETHPESIMNIENAGARIGFAVLAQGSRVAPDQLQEPC